MSHFSIQTKRICAGAAFFTLVDGVAADADAGCVA
jgi:hypothetical protein